MTKWRAREIRAKLASRWYGFRQQLSLDGLHHKEIGAELDIGWRTVQRYEREGDGPGVMYWYALIGLSAVRGDLKRGVLERAAMTGPIRNGADD